MTKASVTEGLPSPQGLGTGIVTTGAGYTPPTVLSCPHAGHAGSLPPHVEDGEPLDHARSRRAEAQRSAKRIALRARFESGVTYEKISDATGRHLAHVYDALNVRNDVRHLTYGDMLSLSRSAGTGTKAFVAHLIAPISANIRGAGGAGTGGDGSDDK